jgi:hypothetical protein
MGASITSFVMHSYGRQEEGEKLGGGDAANENDVHCLT